MSPATSLMMGVSLATATGIRGGLPLLLTAAFARSGQISWHPDFAFLTTDAAMTILIAATLGEILIDFIPGLNHTFDALHIIVRPTAATLIIAGLLVEMPPMVGIAIGLAVGASICAFVHTVKSVGRGLISAATFGLANMAMSLFENIVTGIYALFALVAPGLVFVLTVVLLIVLFFVARRLWAQIRQVVSYLTYKLMTRFGSKETVPETAVTHAYNTTYTHRDYSDNLRR